MLNEITEILAQLVKSAPAGELREVSNDLSIMLPDQVNAVNKSLACLAESQGIVISGKGIASKNNKDPSSSKFWDYRRMQKYNTDFKSGESYDIESATSEVEYPPFFDELVEDLRKYGDLHYPSEFEFEVIPKSPTSLSVSIIGEKLSEGNFYNGRWKSYYVFEDSKDAQGEILLDIHYYEEGNVRFEFKETLQTPCELSPFHIVNFIKSTETAVSMKVVKQFTLLNQKYFKNLRRLLPITKSKINWGNAIGNYKLGADIVNEN